MTDTTTHFGQDFHAQDLRAQDFRGHKFYCCDLSNAIIDETTDLYGAELHNCNLAYLHAEHALFDHVCLSHCMAARMNAKGSTWTQSRALWCDFSGATFKDADVRSLETDHSEFYTSRIQLAKQINPYSRDMLAEVMRIAAKDDWHALQVAALVKCSPDLCWRDFSVMAKTPAYQGIAATMVETFKQLPGMRPGELARYETHETED